MPEQIKAIKSLLSVRSIPDLHDSEGGNNRNIQTVGSGRKVYSFNNTKNLKINLHAFASALKGGFVLMALSVCAVI